MHLESSVVIHGKFTQKNTSVKYKKKSHLYKPLCEEEEVAQLLRCSPWGGGKPGAMTCACHHSTEETKTGRLYLGLTGQPA